MPQIKDFSKIGWWWWNQKANYWSVRRWLLNGIFSGLYFVRCRFIRELRPKEPPEPDAVVQALGEAEQYLGEGSYCRYTLKQGHFILATLVEYTVDFPWVLCHCTVTPAFEAVRPEFEEFWREAQVLGKPDGDRQWQEAMRRIRRLKLRLVPMEFRGVLGPSPLLLYIDGDKARFKISNLSTVTSWPW